MNFFFLVDLFIGKDGVLFDMVFLRLGIGVGLLWVFYELSWMDGRAGGRTDGWSDGVIFGYSFKFSKFEFYF